MIDLPDYGYLDYQLRMIDPAGVVEGSLGGPADIVDRPGLRYAVQFTLPAIPSAKEARIFQTLLEQGLRSDVSYPFPLDFKATPANTPVINGSPAAGMTVPIKSVPPYYQLKQGQAFAVISGGVRYIHRASVATTADATGAMTVPVFPYMRTAYVNNDVVEIERPRIGGVLNWQGSQQGFFGARPFSFTITERR